MGREPNARCIKCELISIIVPQSSTFRMHYTYVDQCAIQPLSPCMHLVLVKKHTYEVYFIPLCTSTGMQLVSGSKTRRMVSPLSLVGQNSTSCRNDFELEVIHCAQVLVACQIPELNSTPVYRIWLTVYTCQVSNPGDPSFKHLVSRRVFSSSVCRFRPTLTVIRGL